MKTNLLLTLAFCLLLVLDSYAQNQAGLLKSRDPELAKNKKLVYDFWREVFEGGHLELAPKYMAEGYIQHNPNVPTGRQAFVDFFSRFAVAKPVADTIKASIIAITADGNLVTLVFKQENTDPKDPAKKYITTWFDMFRIENGKIAEHWDPALKN
ncbi:MAG: nuclear transport factor 2 family protein [Mucilaginibacter sp.]